MRERHPWNTKRFRSAEALLLGIDLGLEDLFGENPEAAQQWLKRPNQNLGGITPLFHIEQALRGVNEALDAARNLR